MHFPPEILEQIFSYLAPPTDVGSSQDKAWSTSMWSNVPLEADLLDMKPVARPQDLYRCALVCRLWAACALPILWRQPRWDRLDANRLESWLQHWQHRDAPIGIDQRPLIDYMHFIQVLKYAPSRCGHTPSPYMLFRMLPKCRNIRAIDLSGLGRTSLFTSLDVDSIESLDRTLVDSSHDFFSAMCSDRMGRQLVSFRAKGWNGHSVSASALPEFTSRLERGFRWTALRHLDLSECYQLNDTILTLLAPRLPNLRHLCLASLPFVTDAAVCAFADPIAYGLPNKHSLPACRHTLESVDISFCPLLTERSVAALMRHCPNLTSINISHCPSISRHIVSTVMWCGQEHTHAPECGGKRLERVSMVYAAITDHDLRAIAECGSALRELRLMACKLITHQGILNLIRRRGVSRDAERNEREGRRLAFLDLSFCDKVLFEETLLMHLGDDEFVPGSSLEDAPLRPTIVYRHRDIVQPWSDRGSLMSGKSISALLEFLERRHTSIL